MSMLQKYSPKCLAVTAAIAGSLILSCAYAEPSCDKGAHPVAPPPATSQTQTHSPYHLNGPSSRASNYYQAAWGVDSMRVRRTASGTLVRFSYRVTDAKRAKILGDKEATPHLVDPKRGVILQVPVMEKIGQLRQTGTPVVGQQYWMVFSNKRDVVKAGDRVDVLIGTFHADGLPVE
jgi:hypothetical protein